MCFSAEASFTAAIALGVIGTLAVKQTTTRSTLFLAVIPFLFGLQQFSEGMEWLHLSYQIGSEEFFVKAQRVFLTFAFLIWPIWISLSLLMVEKVFWRRLMLCITLIGGILLSSLNFFYTLHQDVVVQVVNHSLHYLIEIPKQNLTYFLLVTIPFFLSSLKDVWVAGLVAIGSGIVAGYFYEVTFISVWCFFAAVISLSIYKVIKDNHL